MKKERSKRMKSRGLRTKRIVVAMLILIAVPVLSTGVPLNAQSSQSTQTSQSTQSSQSTQTDQTTQPVHEIDVEKLFKEKDFEALENYCFTLEGKKKRKYYKRLGDAYFEEKDYLSAALSYDRCGYLAGILKAADKLMLDYDYKSALEYYLLLFNTFDEKSPKIQTRIGKAYLELGNVEKAVQFFENGRISGDASIAYEKVAGLFDEKNDPVNAKKYYQKAVKTYETVLKNFFYRWKDSYFPHLRRCLKQLERFEKNDSEKAEQVVLNKILPGVAAYCDRMQNSVFRFFCKEIVSEKIDHTTDIRLIKRFWSNIFNNRLIYPEINKYVFEYQLSKKGNKVMETRRLVKKNGDKKNESDAKLKNPVRQYEKLIFGPIAMLSSFWQKQFYYKVLGEEKLWKSKAVVLEALPLSRNEKNHLFGKIWIDKSDFTVMKIQWYPRSISFAGTIEKNAFYMEAVPAVKFYAEFKNKKKGVRFPSKFVLEEAYLNKKGQKYPRRYQEIIMKNYIYYIVASEVIEESPELFR
jgi:tetratricopeptide (TPR) repeat protein